MKIKQISLQLWVCSVISWIMTSFTGAFNPITYQSTDIAFLSIQRQQQQQQQQQQQNYQKIHSTSHALFTPTFQKFNNIVAVSTKGASTTATSTTTRCYARRRKILDESDLEEEDFLLAEIKPKQLNHERDFFRVSTRIQAWDEYVLVSILCTSISYNALQTFSINPDHQGIYFYEVIVKTLIQTVAGMAVLSGLYSTMVFSISILYGKTALGLERDPQYDKFLDDTVEIRRLGFRAFSLALGLFALLVVLVLSEDLPLVMHLPVGSIMLWAIYVGLRDWKLLTDAAIPIYEDD